MMTTFAEKIISFCKELDFTGSLPDGISIMNPFRTNPNILNPISQFYNKFYDDTVPRHIILGINPGRFGAGVTGIPFTDTYRFREKCGITVPGQETYETSSVFMYEMIDEYGGVERFYSDFYINSVCPLGFTSTGKNNREINYNYYDSKKLTESVFGFMVESITRQIEFGFKRDICYCLGTGKNYKFLSELNDKYHFFDKIIPLEHPRYVMQYKSKKKQLYINLYLNKFADSKSSSPA
jgi:hypothetical protein